MGKKKSKRCAAIGLMLTFGLLCLVALVCGFRLTSLLLGGLAVAFLVAELIRKVDKPW